MARTYGESVIATHSCKPGMVNGRPSSLASWVQRRSGRSDVVFASTRRGSWNTLDRVRIWGRRIAVGGRRDCSEGE